MTDVTTLIDPELLDAARRMVADSAYGLKGTRFDDNDLGRLASELAAALVRVAPIVEAADAWFQARPVERDPSRARVLMAVLQARRDKP